MHAITIATMYKVYWIWSLEGEFSGWGLFRVDVLSVCVFGTLVDCCGWFCCCCCCMWGRLSLSLYAELVGLYIVNGNTFHCEHYFIDAYLVFSWFKLENWNWLMCVCESRARRFWNICNMCVCVSVCNIRSTSLNYT